MKFHLLIVLILMALQQPLPALGGVSGNLAAYLKMAMTNNEEVAAAEARLQAAQNKQLQSGVLPDPILGMQYYLEPVETRTGPQRAAVSLSQRVPWFDKLNLQRKSVGSEVILARITLEKTRLQLAHQLKTGYVEYVFNGHAKKLVGENLDLINYFQEVATTQYSGGKATYGDILKIQIEEAKLQQQTDSLDDKNRPLRIRLNNLMGSDPQTFRAQPDRLPSVTLGHSEEQIYALMLKNNPDLLGAREKMTKARTELELANRDYFPDFTFSLKTIITDSPDDGGQGAGGSDPLIGGVSMNIPIFFERRRAGVAEKNGLLLARTREQQQQVRILTTQIEETFFTYRDADRRYELYEKSLLPKANQTLEVALEGFQAGQYSTAQAIAAQRDLLDFQLAKSRALADRLIAIAAIENLAGVTLANWNQIDVATNLIQNKSIHKSPIQHPIN